jgi:hypothetical protein
MTDRNGRPVVEGARVRFRAETRDGAWLTGTVRKVGQHTYHRPTVTMWEARVDDGDPSNPDLSDNGFHVAAHVESAGIEVLDSGVAQPLTEA